MYNPMYNPIDNSMYNSIDNSMYNSIDNSMYNSINNNLDHYQLALRQIDEKDMSIDEKSDSDSGKEITRRYQIKYIVPSDSVFGLGGLDPQSSILSKEGSHLICNNIDSVIIHSDEFFSYKMNIEQTTKFAVRTRNGCYYGRTSVEDYSLTFDYYPTTNKMNPYQHHESRNYNFYDVLMVYIWSNETFNIKVHGCKTHNKNTYLIINQKDLAFSISIGNNQGKNFIDKSVCLTNTNQFVDQLLHKFMV